MSLNFELNKGTPKDMPSTGALRFSTEHTEEAFPLSPTQAGMLFHSLFAPEAGLYLEQIILRVDGDLDVRLFENSWQRVVDHHEILRTSFRWEGLDSPLQIVHRQVAFPFQQHDWSELTAVEQDSRWESFVRADRESGFDFSQPPLMRISLIRLAADSYRLIWTNHHTLLDGWSQSLILKQVFSVYRALAAGAEPSLEPSPSYRNYIDWLAAQDSSAAEHFWKQALKGFIAPTSLGRHGFTAEPRSEVVTHEELGLRLSVETTAELQAFARKHRLTMFTLVQGAWALLLGRYSGTEDVAFGTTVSVRPPELPDIESAAGLFINTIPVRTRLPADVDLLSWFKELQLETVEAREHQHSSLLDIQSWSEVPKGSPLFESILAFENYPRDEDAGNLGLRASAQPVSSILSRTNYPLTLLAFPGAELQLSVVYDSGRFDAEATARMLGHLSTILAELVADPTRKLAELSLLTTWEREQLLVEWNQTEAEYEKDLCVYQLFEKQAASTPNAIALEFDEQRLTYGELNARANQLAHYLRRLGVGPESLVGICIERSLEMVVGLLGILKAGGAYVPLDPSFPKERLAFMIEDANVPVLLTQQKLTAELPAHQAKLVCIDADWEMIACESAADPSSVATSDNLAYVIYTSGSTGKPKGVQIEHRALTNFLCSVRREPGLKPADVLLSVTTLSFDIAALELYLPLLVGARLVIVSRDVSTDANQLKQKIAQAAGTEPEAGATGFFSGSYRNDPVATAQGSVPAGSKPWGATVVQATPATWRMLIDAGWQGSRRLKVLCGGEALSRELADQLLERSGSLWNMYGPTETTIWSTVCKIESGDEPVSIGRPLANTQVYLLDPNLNPVPLGVPGELHIGGDGLARGYLNRPELTSEKFIRNPFNRDASARLYKTGDLARYFPDGNIECLGRIDDQVKLRGFRIELGEIESALHDHVTVHESVVVAREDSPGDRRLVAYVVPANNFKIDSQELRGFLKEKLPEYMIPSVFIGLEELPLTPNGKVNRRALPAPDYDAQLHESYVTPRTAVEELLCGICAEVLKVSRVGVNDNFFELGGHSLLATQIVSRVLPTFKVELPLRALFESPTVAGMAKCIEALRGSAATLATSAITRSERDGAVPLSFGQQSFWFLDSLTPNTSLYNIFRAVRLHGELSVPALQQALDALMARHESLRTVFSSVNGQPVQVIAEDQEFQLVKIDLVHLSSEAREADLQKLLKEAVRAPFDLAHGPLVRATVFRLDADEHVLLLSMHHIVADDWSMGIFSRELENLYDAFATDQEPQLPELPIQYADFAQWQHAWSQNGTLEKQLQYWQQQLAGAPPLIELPTDRPRPSGPTFHGAHHTLTLSGALRDRLVKLSERESVSLFMTLLAAFQTLLAQYSGQDDIVVGSPIAGRNRLETENLIGHFINTLVLRTSLAGDPTFSELLARVRDVALGAYGHQEAPFEKLVEALQPQRNLSYTPLFQVMFVFQNASASDLNLSGLSIRNEELHGESAPLDLTLEARETADGIRCVFEYKTDLFDAITIERVAERFQLLLERAVDNPAQNISSLALLTEAEQRRLLIDWNSTGRDYPRDLCIQQLFEAQAEQTPDAPAVIFLDQSLTYGELNERANQLGHLLRARDVGAESLVGICVERSLEMIVGVLGILKAGAAYVPLDPNYPRERLNLILQDAGISLVLTQEKVAAVLSEFSGAVLCLDADWKQIVRERADNPVPLTTAESLAYVIYTSGSTGTPKGVMIAHRSLVNFTMNARTDYELGAADKVLQFASLNFDTSAEEIFPCLASGGTLVLRTDEMLSSVSQFLRACDDWAITVLDLPTAYWHEIAAEFERARPPLPRDLRLLIIGGERALPERLSIWQQSVGSNVRLVNTYGPTEATIVATKWEAPLPGLDGPSQKLPIGRPLGNVTVYLLDRKMNLVPIGTPGELHIGGDGLARGYLNRPELTAEKFVSNPFSSDAQTRLYKTGDLARYLPDGNIEYLGRIDNQVKIRGFRIELGEIESALRQHAKVRECVVVVREDTPGNKRLIGYVVPVAEMKVDSRALRAFLQETLPEYMVPETLIELLELPLTPSGKMDRRALPAPNYDAQLKDTFVAPRTPVEELLCGIWAEVLKVSRVGINDNFFELGGHSLLATQVVSRVLQTFAVQLPLRALFEAPTVAALAGRIHKISNSEETVLRSEIVRTARQEVPPLSFAQKRLWFLDQLEGSSGSYNISRVVRITGPLNVAALQQTLSEIVSRHESLRTNFELLDEDPVQTISPPRAMEIAFVDLRDQPAFALQQRIGEMSQRPFDLAHDQLLRASLLQVDEQDHVLLLTMHHIVSDGWSMSVLFREIAALYEAFVNGQPSPLVDLPIQYRDFASWQREWLQGDVLQTQVDYWKKQLDGAPAVLELPTDRPRPPLQTFNGACHSIVLSHRLSESLSELSRHADSTLFMTLLAAFQTLLCRYTNQEDIVLGTPIANRTRRETEDLIGFFVNTLVMRTDLSGNPAFSELLRRVREVALQSYAHQDLPFEKLVEELKPERSLSHMPLFQVLVVFQNAPEAKLALPGLELQDFSLEGQTAKFDLSLYIGESHEGLRLTFEYNTDLFNPATIEQIARQFETLLAGIVANPDQRLGDLPLLDEAERRQLLVEWTDTSVDYPIRCIHELFAEQAATTPEAIAVISEGRQLTFAELDRRANQLAHYLQKRGVGPEVIVAVCLERSIEMVVALLGILKAGGAFVPVDPSYPAERVTFLLTDSRAPIVLTQRRTMESLTLSGAEPICLDARWAEIAAESREAPVCSATPDNAAYLAYTSGSTGTPKGSISPHHASLNRFAWMWRTFPFAPGEVCCQKTSLSFVDSIWENFGPLLRGIPLVIIPDDAARDPQQLVELLGAHDVTRIVLVPSLLRVLLEQQVNLAQKLPRLKYWTCSGESLPLELAQSFKQKLPAAVLINLYGSSEIAADVTCYEVSEPDQLSGIPIGWAIDNTEAYILDGFFEPVPVGVCGDLYIAGAGLARGYFDHPELTAERFLANPFSCDPGARMFRTGDLARYRPDGTIEFLGRADHQVKIRGFRIELGEIESVLGQHRTVRQSVVVVREDVSGDSRLIAYIVPFAGARVDHKVLRAFLQRKLPEYMIPSVLVELPELPLTPSGKINRRALPAPEYDAQSKQNYLAPRTEVEELLCVIWAEVLKVSRVGINDNFFELGGHSLLAVRLFARIEKLCGKHLPLATLFQAPTVAQLAQVLREEGWTAPWSSLVPIQATSHNTRAKRPLFCVHAVGGNVIEYHDLARYLGPEQPFYAFQSVGLDGRQAPLKSIPAMASHYIKEMREVQPAGPYLLGGHSLGGMIAFEMACQLREQGEQVDLLALFDAYPLGHYKLQPDANSRTYLARRFAKRMKCHFDNLLHLEGKEKLAYLLDKAQFAPAKIKQQLWRRTYRLRRFNRAIPATLRNIEGLNFLAAREYVPRIYPGRVALFWASDDLSTSFDLLDGWRTLASGGVDIHEISGNHINIIKEPHVRALADELRACLDQLQFGLSCSPRLQPGDQPGFSRRAYLRIRSSHQV